MWRGIGCLLNTVIMHWYAECLAAWVGIWFLYTKCPGYVIYASIHWEKDVIFLGLIIGQIDSPAPMMENVL